MVTQISLQEKKNILDICQQLKIDVKSYFFQIAFRKSYYAHHGIETQGLVLSQVSHLMTDYLHFFPYSQKKYVRKKPHVSFSNWMGSVHHSTDVGPSVYILCKHAKQFYNGT